jgi:hypothetical protein
MSTNTSRQNIPAEHQATHVSDIDHIEPADDSRYAYDVATPLNFDSFILDMIANIDNSAFTNDEALEIYRRLIQRFLAAQANLQQLTDDTALSMKELQHEIDAAKCGLEYREVMLGRYNQGWRAKMQKVRRSSRPKELRQGIESHKSVVVSMERIKRLVMDNEAARLPAVTEEAEMSLERVQGYDVYLGVRGIVVLGDAANV